MSLQCAAQYQKKQNNDTHNGARGRERDKHHMLGLSIQQHNLHVQLSCLLSNV